ncbi:MAG: beta-hydroxyacyl-ACP dehydratase [Planctomycetes bacterium]|nr:beta-hydroxyacyl-ACP dehydratase [Planctomycetota bacterium]
MGSEARAIVMDRAAIERAIPHRAPFLFVDRVLERVDGRIVTEWDVPADLPAFQGHYPGRPVLPGVLASEFCFQSAAILFAQPGAPEAPRGAVPVLTRIQDARFKRLVQPGETLRAELATTEELANVRWVQAHVTSSGKSVLRIRFAVALIDPGAPESAEDA